MIMIESIPNSKVGDIVEVDGKKLKITEEYTSGDLYKRSGDPFYMMSPKGVMGLREVPPEVPAEPEPENS